MSYICSDGMDVREKRQRIIPEAVKVPIELWYRKFCPRCGRFLGVQNYIPKEGEREEIKCGNCRNMVTPAIKL